MKYAKIKQGTEAWVLMNNVFTFKNKWREHESEISAFLGFPMDSNIAFEVSNLWVHPDTLEKYRPDWVSQFKKNESPTPAKTKSKVKKEWIELCAKLNLETFRIRDFTWKYGLAFQGAFEVQKMDEEYLISMDNDKYDFAQHDWAEILEEATFYRMKADYLEKEAEKAAS